MQRPQKIKIFANANVVGLEKEMNSFLKTDPIPMVKEVKMTGWGSGGGAGDYTIVAIILYE